MAEGAVQPDLAGGLAPPIESHPGSEPGRRTLDQNGYDRLAPADQGKWVEGRDADYRSVFVERDGGDQARATSADVRVEGDRITIGELTATEAELRDWLVQIGSESARKAALPANPGEYRAELPKDFKLPAGTDFVIDAASPALEDLRRLAHGNGWTQETFSTALSIYAGEKAAEQTRLNAAKDAERAKLGPNGSARVTAIEHWVRGMLGDQDARTLMLQGMYTAAGTAAFERLMGKYVTQGGSSSYSRAHTEPPEQAGRVSDEAWAAMGPGERMAYARQHDQSRFR